MCEVFLAHVVQKSIPLCLVFSAEQTRSVAPEIFPVSLSALSPSHSVIQCDTHSHTHYSWSSQMWILSANGLTFKREHTQTQGL